MKNTLSKVLIFAAGAAVGAAATWKLLDTKYQVQAIKEAEEIREYYRGKYGEDGDEATEEVEESDDESDPNTDADFHEYESVLSNNGYTNYAAGGVREERPKEVKDVERPYVISPEEFGETDYKTVSLTYYKDEVLADSRGKIVKNVDDVVGLDSLDHFGEFEDDSVFVRNDAKKTDYEILLDDRAYAEIINKNTHSTEDE